VSLLVLDDVCLNFGQRAILDHAGLRIGHGDRIGLIGPNGSGKSTLLRIIAGEQAIDKGSVQRARGVSIGYLPQDLAIAGGRTLMAMVLSSVPGRTELDAQLAAAEQALEQASAAGERDEELLMELAARVAEAHERADHFERFFSEHQAHRILAGLGFSTADRERDVAEFSGGWKMRGVLASLLFQQPDVLLLDEPTNHLDMPSVAWLSDFLQRYRRAFVLISHDREFLDEQVARIVSFEVEGLRQYTGNYEQYLRQRAEEEEILENQARNQAREREHLQRFVDRFRAQANKARQVQSRIKALEKMDEVQTLGRRKVMRFHFRPTPPAVSEVLRCEHLGKRYGQHQVFAGVDLVVRRGEKIGIIGPNGAGKTTLLRIIAGELPATGGQVRRGNNIAVGYFAQHHADALRSDATVYEEVAAANPHATPSEIRAALGAFLFSGDDVDKRIAVLSGGERARVSLARLFINPGNLMLMDEPTNHLDLASAESLADSLVQYDGTLIFVSHNRHLIRRLATRIWHVDGGAVETYPGTLDEYMHSCRLRQEGAEEAASGAAPQRETARGDRAAAAADAAEAARRDREAERVRKRREAELRQKRSKVVGPLQRQVAELEERITALESAQAERSAQLSDPAVYEDAGRRNQLLGDFQRASDELERLTARWEGLVGQLEQAEAELRAAETAGS
jgi:ATP-binding cassette subfamily F protein 3